MNKEIVERKIIYVEQNIKQRFKNVVSHLKAYRNKTLSDKPLVESNFVESHTLDIVES